jgi:hypothetical protein
MNQKDYNIMSHPLTIRLPDDLIDRFQEYIQETGLDDEQALISLIALALHQEAPAPSEPTTRSLGSSNDDSPRTAAAPDRTIPPEAEH